MKNISKFLALFLMVATFVSCDEDDVDPVLQIDKPTMTFDIQDTYTVPEGTNIPYTINLSAPVSEAFNVYLMVYPDKGSTINTALGNDGGDLANFDSDTYHAILQKQITIPAYATSFSGTINIAANDLPNDTKVAVVTMGDSRTSVVNFVPKDVTINITNTTSQNLVISVDWRQTFTVGATTYNTGTQMDFDAYIFDANSFALVSQEGATGAVPETVIFEDYPDGDYLIAIGLYASTINLATPRKIPVTATFSKPGIFASEGQITLPVADQFTTSEVDPTGADLRIIGFVNVLNNPDGTVTYTISDAGNNPVFSGKSASQVKSLLKANISKLKK